LSPPEGSAKDSVSDSMAPAMENIASVPDLPLLDRRTERPLVC
jgi:hypothetical protein